MKAFKGTCTLITLCVMALIESSFAQVSIDNLKGKNWQISATQFEDGSYVVSCQHFSESTKVIFLDKEGKKTMEKNVDPKYDWTFGERQFRRYKSKLNIPLIDKKNKICYNLIGKDGKLSITIVNQNMEFETINLKAEVYKKFYGFSEVFEPIRNFDDDGNPIWIITEGRRGILKVKYNLKSKTIEHRFYEFEGYSNIVKGYDYISADVIGYMDNKIWFARVTDRGLKVDNCTISIYSIDENDKIKKEQDYKMKKSDKDLGMTIRAVNQCALNSKVMYFTFSTIKTNNAIGITSLRFMRFDGEELQNVLWENNTETVINHNAIMASETDEQDARFVINDIYGNAIAWDIDFNNSGVIGISALQGMAQDNQDKIINSQEDVMIFSYFLYENILDENLESNIGDFKAQGNTPLIFKGNGNNFFLIKGNFKEETTSYKTQF
jgi:hypothetical protein